MPTRISFVDIAGLVRGASKGEGLGNQFLANIREVDAIVHVLRCFEGTDVTHVEGRVDPVADAETVNTELMLADLDSLERRVDAAPQAGRSPATRKPRPRSALMDAALDAAREGQAGAAGRGPARTRSDASAALNLLTAKPVLYVANVDEASAATGNAHSAARRGRWPRPRAPAPSSSPPRSRPRSRSFPTPRSSEFLDSLGLDEPGLDRLIRAGYDLLGLITYFTAGPKEVRAWTIAAGTRAPQAAGVIHTDFEKGFIRAQTIAYDDFIRLGGEQARQGSRQGARRRQGLRRRGRRRDAVQVQRVGAHSCRLLPEDRPRGSPH